MGPIHFAEQQSITHLIIMYLLESEAEAPHRDTVVSTFTDPGFDKFGV